MPRPRFRVAFTAFFALSSPRRRRKAGENQAITVYSSSKPIRVGRVPLWAVPLAALCLGISSVPVSASTADEIETLPLQGSLNRSEGLRSLGKAILGVPILDGFGREELPLENGRWSRTRWTEEVGSSWRGKWHGYGANLSHLAGAYWNGAIYNDSDGPIVVAANLGTGPVYERWSNEYLSLWLDMPNPGRVRSGYEVRFRGANRTFADYKVELSKWASGHRTVLAKAKRISLPENTTFALSEAGGNLVVWTGTNALTPILSATDSTYGSGYTGIEANRGEGTAYSFRAGNVG